MLSNNRGPPMGGSDMLSTIARTSSIWTLTFLGLLN